MGLFDIFQSDHDDVHHQGSLTHDALAGAVAYEAAKAYENHRAENGEPDSHAKAKEIAAGLVGAALTRLVETKGLDAYDEHKKRALEKQARERLEVVVEEERIQRGY